MRSLNIITECCVDTNMVETLCSVLVNHQKCCSKLSSVLMYLNNNKYNSTEAGVKCIVEEGRCKM